MFCYPYIEMYEHRVVFDKVYNWCTNLKHIETYIESAANDKESRLNAAKDSLFLVAVMLMI